MSATPVPVVHVITQLELGGAQQATLATVASLDRERWAPQLVCGPGGMLDEEARALPGVPVHFVQELARPLRPLRDLAAVRGVQALLRPLAEGGPVIVHTHSSKAGVVGRRAAELAGAKPVVHSIHGFGHGAIGNPAVRRLALAIERRMARCTDAFVGVSRANIDEGRALGLLGDAPAHLIRSGIDLAEFARADSLRDAARAGLGLHADAPVVGMLACLKPQKAPADFVEIAARVAREMPEARFFLAGDGELRGEVEQRIARHGLGDRFLLLGWRRDVPALLGALDVLVLTSRWEGLPRVCPQAMAAGRPVVATRVDGIPEAVVDDRNGSLVEPGDVDGAAARVLGILRDPALAARFAAAGREAVDEFGVAHMLAATERLYTELLA
ncbi:MAG: glycosyltransferase family 4 protein [Planctomycetota bacterium]